MLLNELIRLASLAGIQPGGDATAGSPAPPASAPALVTAPVEADAPGQNIPVAGHIPYDYHGMFGLRGNARNILGALGDAFLVQSGNHPTYAPRRQQERESNAQRGFVDSPLSAIGRLSKENPAAAREMYNDYLTQQRLARSENRQERDSDAQYGGMVNDRALRLIGTATPENWPRLRAQILQYYNAHGVQPAFELPETYDANAIDALRRSAVPVDRQTDDDALAAYRQEYIDLRRSEAATRAAQGERRIDQGDARIAQGNRRIIQGDTRLGQGAARVHQGDVVLDQYERGVRGPHRRPAPGAATPPQPVEGMIRRARNPQGQVTETRVWHNGRWVLQ